MIPSLPHARGLDVDNHAKLHIDEIVVGVGKERRPAHRSRPLGGRIRRRDELRRNLTRRTKGGITNDLTTDQSLQTWSSDKLAGDESSLCWTARIANREWRIAVRRAFFNFRDLRQITELFQIEAARKHKKVPAESLIEQTRAAIGFWEYRAQQEQ